MKKVYEMNNEDLKLKGKYLGLSLPGIEPEIFAPEIVNTHHHEHSGAATVHDHSRCQNRSDHTLLNASRRARVESPVPEDKQEQTAASKATLHR